ncbi:hypothetical protein DMB42_22145 [Nonomuraea sp. WAC 01424]|nr:hypothetical protein DMB42_22145 [Nonomuraea sp. WAC 01424]
MMRNSSSVMRMMPMKASTRPISAAAPTSSTRNSIVPLGSLIRPSTLAAIRFPARCPSTPSPSSAVTMALVSSIACWQMVSEAFSAITATTRRGMTSLGVVDVCRLPWAIMITPAASTINASSALATRRTWPDSS